MKFEAIEKKGCSGTKSVFANDRGGMYYICDMVPSSHDSAEAINSHGLTLRARYDRSKGLYVMFSGNIFNPYRLSRIVCEVTKIELTEFRGKEYKDGYTRLLVEADGMTNIYHVFSKYEAQRLEGTFKKLMN